MTRQMCAIVALAGCSSLASAQLYGSDSSGNYYLVDETNGNATIITSDDSTYNFLGGATEIEVNPATGIGYAQNPNGVLRGNLYDAVTGASLSASVVTNDVFQWDLRGRQVRAGRVRLFQVGQAIRATDRCSERSVLSGMITKSPQLAQAIAPPLPVPPDNPGPMLPVGRNPTQSHKNSRHHPWSTPVAP